MRKIAMGAIATLTAVMGLFVLAIGLESCQNNVEEEEVEKVDPYYVEYLPARAAEAEEYAKTHGLNTDYCILVDFGIPSGSPRVFVWSFTEGKLDFTAHTMHGTGGGSTRQNPVLSNVSGSNCSAPGHFLVTNTHGTLIPSGYFLRGLDAANSNARQRGLMLHGYAYDDGRGDGYLPINAAYCSGCITVFNSEFDRIEELLLKSNKRPLLWSFDSKKGIEVPVYQ